MELRGCVGTKSGDITTGLIEIYMIGFVVRVPKNINLRKKLQPYEDLMSKKI